MYRPARVGLLCVVLLVALVLGTGSVLASDHHAAATPVGPPVQGTVTLVMPNSLQILSQGVGLAFALTDGTQVIRACLGSLADVHPGQHVYLHLIKGTTTADAIHIAASRGPTSDRGGRVDDVVGPRVESLDSIDASWPHAQGRPSTPSGQVISLQKGSITLRVSHGKSVTYSLSASLTVTKLLDGTIADLATGETVSVQRARDGSAAVVEIINA